jgi:hypothetical protein
MFGNIPDMKTFALALCGARTYVTLAKIAI